jgi:hypothetical protein
MCERSFICHSTKLNRGRQAGTRKNAMQEGRMFSRSWLLGLVRLSATPFVLFALDSSSVISLCWTQTSMWLAVKEVQKIYLEIWTSIHSQMCSTIRTSKPIRIKLYKAMTMQILTHRSKIGTIAKYHVTKIENTETKICCGMWPIQKRMFTAQ